MDMAHLSQVREIANPFCTPGRGAVPGEWTAPLPPQWAWPAPSAAAAGGNHQFLLDTRATIGIVVIDRVMLLSDVWWSGHLRDDELSAAIPYCLWCWFYNGRQINRSVNQPIDQLIGRSFDQVNWLIDRSCNCSSSQAISYPPNQLIRHSTSK